MKVAVLIDGFNLYHHMDNYKYSKYKWLNFAKFFRNYVNSRDKLEIHYFTTINYEDIRAYKINPEKQKEKLQRHLDLIKAEESYGVIVHYGNFKDTDFTCRECGHKNIIRKEKQTDVSIGAYLSYLAFSRNYEKFLILSADTDLIGAIKLVKENDVNIRIDLLLPPGVKDSDVSNYCDRTFIIKEEELKNSLFPLVFENKKNETIVCPEDWRTKK